MDYAQTTSEQPARTAGRLEMRWLPVTDDRGHTRMEACWIAVGPAVTTHHAA